MPLHICDAIIEESEYGKNTVYTLKDATLLKQEGRISAAKVPHFCRKSIALKRSRDAAEMRRKSGGKAAILRQ